MMQHHRPALYNPALWSREEIKTYFIARRSTLERIMGDLRRESPDTNPQHRLILGQRGMGKSTMLRRIAIEVEEDEALNEQWLPLTFPEEQYNVATLADFWLNCLDALSDLLEERGDSRLAEEMDDKVEALNRKDGDSALKTLLQTAKKMNRRLLLLVDNIDLILERLKKEDWRLREALQENREIALIGASARALESTYDYGAAFYDFFKIDELRGLTLEEMRETIITLAKLRGAEDVIHKVEKDPVRLQVLHTLTGGNPRTTVLLYGVLLKGVESDVRSDLEGLLDEVTPLYKARFEELPALSQQILDKVALHWDPVTARQLADSLEMEINLASSQLSRLSEMGVLEKVKSGQGKRMAFQVGERFFNIWYLMRASRRVRRKLVWLVEFLRMFYSAEELRFLARNHLNTKAANSPEYLLALARTLPQEPISRALESSALEILFSKNTGMKLEELLDVSGEDKDLLPRAERIKLLQEYRKKLKKMLKDANVDFSIEVFIEQLLGAPVPLEKRRSLIETVLRQGKCDTKTWKMTSNYLKEFWARRAIDFGPSTAEKLRIACAHGDMTSIGDMEGGEAAAERYNAPILALLPRLTESESEIHTSEQGDHLIRKIIEIDASGALHWSILGNALSEKPERMEEAVEAYRQAIELDPLYTRAWRGLCYVLPLMNRNEEAGQALKKWTDLEPDNSAAWAALAIHQHLIQKNDDEANISLQNALKVPKKARDGLGLMTFAMFLLKKVDEALPLFRQYLEVEDTSLTKLVDLIEIGLPAGAGKQLLAIFDESEAGQRWRPIREALAAAVANDAGLLNGVAPEVRKPALEILQIIAPELADSTGNKAATFAAMA